MGSGTLEQVPLLPVGRMDLQIRTLGRFAVILDGRELTSIPGQPTRAALLLYLAVEGKATREAAAAVVWSELPPDNARHSLNQTLYRLRGDLGEEWLRTEGDRLVVTDRVGVDVRALERAVAAGEWERALGLYEGAFLDGWHLLDASPFEHWVDRHHLRFGRLHREANRARIGALRSAGSPGDAVEVARAWVRKDLLEDEAHHVLIELLAETGRRAEALEHYESYCRALAAEELRPLEPTEALVRQVREGVSEGPGAAGALGDALSGAGEGTRRGGRRALRSVAGALAIAAILLLTVFVRGPDAPRLEARRVLVLPLENQTNDPALDPAGQMVADWMTQGLASLDFFQVVPYAELAGGVPEDEASGPSLARAFHTAKGVGAGTIVTGRYYASGEGLELHVHLTDVGSGEILEMIGPIRTAAADLGEAADVLRQRVMVSLAVRLDESLDGIFNESAMPPTYAAYVAYYEGSRKIAVGDWRAALPDLLRANELEPGYTTPLIFAGFAFMNALGDFGRADSVAQVVEASRSTLPRYDWLRLDLLQAKLRGDTHAAYRAVREAGEITPGGSAHFTAAQLALQINRPGEALATLATFDPTRPFVQEWTPYWEVLTAAHHLQGDHGRELSAARRGRAQMPDRLELLEFEARALAALGRVGELERLLDQVPGMRSPQVTAGAVLLRTVRELRVHGHRNAAHAVAQRLLALHDLWADRERSDEAAHERAAALYLDDQLAAAREAFLRLRHSHPKEPVYPARLGAIAARTGDVTAAHAYADTLAAMDRPYVFGRHTLGQAAIAARLGNPDRAVTLLRAALGKGVTFGTNLHSHPDLLVLRGYPPFDDLMRPDG